LAQMVADAQEEEWLSRM